MSEMSDEGRKKIIIALGEELFYMFVQAHISGRVGNEDKEDVAFRLQKEFVSLLIRELKL